MGEVEVSTIPTKPQQALLDFLGNQNLHPREMRDFHTYTISEDNRTIGIAEGVQLNVRHSRLFGLADENSLKGITATIVLLDIEDPNFVELVVTESLGTSRGHAGESVMNSIARSILGGGYRGFQLEYENPNSQQKQLLRQQCKEHPQKDIVIVLGHGRDVDSKRVIAGIDADKFFNEVVPEAIPDYAERPAFIDMACSTSGVTVDPKTLKIPRYWAATELVSIQMETKGDSVCIQNNEVLTFIDRPAPMDPRDFWGPQ